MALEDALPERLLQVGYRRNSRILVVDHAPMRDERVVPYIKTNSGVASELVVTREVDDGNLTRRVCLGDDEPEVGVLSLVVVDEG